MVGTLVREMGLVRLRVLSEPSILDNRDELLRPIVVKEKNVLNGSGGARTSRRTRGSSQVRSYVRLRRWKGYSGLFVSPPPLLG